MRARLDEVTDPLSLLEGIFALSPNALQVFGPNGATVTVGKPFGFDDPTFPTFVRVSSTGTACTVPTSPRTVIASMPPSY